VISRVRLGLTGILGIVLLQGTACTKGSEKGPANGGSAA
jgi:hypothetical protein